MSYYTTSHETKYKQAKERAQGIANRTGRSLVLVPMIYGTLGVDYSILAPDNVKGYIAEITTRDPNYSVGIIEDVKPETESK